MLRQRRRENGVCTKCGASPPRPGRDTCQPCWDKTSAYDKSLKSSPSHAAKLERRRAKRNENKAAGLCVECGKINDTDKTRCLICTSKSVEIGRRSRRNRRNGKLCIDCGEVAVKRSLCSKCDVRRKQRLKLFRDSVRQQVIEHYGGKCKCCSESEPMFLEVDHVNNDGAEHRRQLKLVGNRFYIWIIRNNFPADLQILCSNCNMGKHRNGGTCPHQNKL